MCEIIWEVLQPEFVRAPASEAEWEGIARQFQQIWNFPHCRGKWCIQVYCISLLFFSQNFLLKEAIDVKHVQLQAPSNAGSEFYNYKGFHSIVLLAVCDVHYRYNSSNNLLLPLLILILKKVHSCWCWECQTSQWWGGGALSHSSFGQALEQKMLHIPKPCGIPG